MRVKRSIKFIGVFLILLFAISFISCAATKGTGGAKGSSSPPSEAEKPQHRYYDFNDILIPEGLKLNQTKSFIYETPSMKAGVLIFHGRLGIPFLLSFFKDNMEMDNWRFMSGFGYRDSLLSFEKDERMCWIKIYKGGFTTTVEIWVGPIDREAIIMNHDKGGMSETDLK